MVQGIKEFAPRVEVPDFTNFEEGSACEVAKMMPSKMTSASWGQVAKKRDFPMRM